MIVGERSCIIGGEGPVNGQAQAGEGSVNRQAQTDTPGCPNLVRQTV
jgi:hypothetical protein